MNFSNLEKLIWQHWLSGTTALLTCLKSLQTNFRQNFIWMFLLVLMMLTLLIKLTMLMLICMLMKLMMLMMLMLILLKLMLMLVMVVGSQCAAMQLQ